jgi:hypothetical protein
VILGHGTTVFTSDSRFSVSCSHFIAWNRSSEPYFYNFSVFKYLDIGLHRVKVILLYIAASPIYSVEAVYSPCGVDGCSTI